MYPSLFSRALYSEFWRSESTNGCCFAIQSVIDDFFWILASSFAAKELAVGFHKKNRVFIEIVFFLILLKLQVPQCPGPSSFVFFCVVCNPLHVNRQAGGVRAPLANPGYPQQFTEYILLEGDSSCHVTCPVRDAHIY